MRRKDPRTAGRFERLLLSVMGPPQIGDVNAPVHHVDLPLALCAKCGRPYDDHEIVRDPGLTYTRCPVGRVPSPG